MQTFMPPSLVAAVAPAPLANPPSRGLAANGDTPFARHLEKLRETRAQDRTSPAATDKPPSPPRPPSANRAQQGSGPAAAANVQASRAAHAAVARKAEAPAEAAEPNTDTRVEQEQPAKAETTDPAVNDMAGFSSPLDPPVPPSGPSITAVTLALAVPPVEPAKQIADTATQPEHLAPDDASQARRAGATTHLAALTEPGRTASRTAAHDPPALAHTDPAAGTWQQAQAAAVLAETVRTTPELREAAPSEPALATPAIAGPGNPAAHAGRAGEVATVNLATPAAFTTAAEFRAALGVQLSLLARAGVQQAELHLNPAEMGPVSIQIVLDGQQAQVNFGADSALTRQLIESGMPELASALSDAGLTLTGGGVSQHAGGQRQDPNPHAAPGSRASNAGSTTAPAGQTPEARRSTLRAAQGGIDLYA